ncbi:MAG: hypothetical protein COB37_01955 [Kordiimonadales bacterium]|nr:MAG: hypothetical protein COB37_01955 [Kordiimonadales bacterium]
MQVPRKKRPAPTMSKERAKEILVEIGYDIPSLQKELNRLLGTNYQNRDVWKWFNTTSAPLTAQLFLLMKQEELARADALKKKLFKTIDA